MADNWSFMTVRELADLVREREVSPVELAEYFLDRLEKRGPEYNAVVTVTRERALAEARAAEAEINGGTYRGPLHGIPYGVKDLLAAKLYPTTWGAAPYKEQVFDYDGTVITRLQAAGAVLLAKLAMVELAGGMGYNHADASLRITTARREKDRGRPVNCTPQGRFSNVLIGRGAELSAIGRAWFSTLALRGLGCRRHRDARQVVHGP